VLQQQFQDVPVALSHSQVDGREFLVVERLHAGSAVEEGLGQLLVTVLAGPVQCSVT
jgi:hypothetical protein